MKGLEQVMRNLNKEIKAIENRSLKGMILASIEIMNDTDKTPPKVPIDTGNLRASRFITASNGRVEGDSSYANLPDDTPFVVFGFGANYAAKVHESYGTGFKRPGSGAGFLESSVKRNKDNAVKIILDNAKIK